MDESAMKVQESNRSDAKSRNSIRRMVVEGYDTFTPHDDLDTALREHFSSCGEIVHVYIPRKANGDRLGRFALIYLRGEGAEDKALELCGRDMEGTKLDVKSYPFEETYLDTKLAHIRAADCWRQRVVGVTGYDTSVPKDVVSRRLREHFSSSVEVVHEDICGVGLHRIAMIFLKGEDLTEKALRLSGSSDVGGWKIEVTKVAQPPNKKKKHPNMWGYTPPELLPTEKKDFSIWEKEKKTRRSILLSFR